MTKRRQRREFTEEFKKQIVQLHNSGKARSEIVKEYDLTASAFDRWVERINGTGSSKEKDNRSPEQPELLRLQKENKKLKTENDILKQAALIFAQKQK
jgi:transposase